MKTVLRFVYCVAKIIYGCQHANHQGQKLLVLTGSCTANWASGYFGDMLPHIRVEYEFNTRSILIYCTINVEKKNLLLKQKLKESWVADVEKRNIYWGRKTFMLKAWNIFFPVLKLLFYVTSSSKCAIIVLTVQYTLTWGYYSIMWDF